MGQALLGGLGSLGMVGFALAGGNHLFIYLAVGLACVTVTAAVAGRVHTVRRSRRTTARLSRRWRMHLALQHQGALDAAAGQRLERLAGHPGATGLLARSRAGPALWRDRVAVGAAARPSFEPGARVQLRSGLDLEERWPVRLGTGCVPARQPLRGESATDPLAETDADLDAALAAAIAQTARVTDTPVVYHWAPGSVLALVGPLEATRSVARAILAGLLIERSPSALRITIDSADPGEWDWLAWVPHDVALGSVAGGAELLVREIGDAPADAADHPGSTSGRPGGPERTLLLAPTRRGFPSGVQVFDLGELPSPLPDGELLGVWVTLDRGRAARLARSLAPLAIGQSGRRRGEVGLFDLIRAAPGLTSGTDSRCPDLRVPLGVDGDTDIWLDLREPAADGDGPHGLLIGSTGSGKSELLRSVVLGLAWRHAPEQLAFVLADWKGGAAFDDVAGLPHVAGLMTNLGDDPLQVSRMVTSLRAELGRRQVVLRAAGAESLAALRASTPQLAPPALVVVIDEFGELLAAEPDVLDVLLACGRLGRSLGVHLLLSSQRLEEGRLRGLDSHLRYRICLRVSSAGESQAVIGSVRAAELPAEPGWGYLSVDGNTRRFRAAHSSRPVAPVRRPEPVQHLVLPTRQPRRATLGETERARAVRLIVSLGRPRVPPVWHPPLPEVIARPDAAAGSWSLGLGIADEVEHQCQPPWRLDLEACGHVGVVGGPSSGVSTLLRGILTAGAESLSAGELVFVIADYGGLDRSGLQDLPQLLCLCGPEDPDLALAALRWAAQTVEARGQHARRLGITGPGGWRRAREAGELDPPPGDSGADVLVVVDGLARARDDVEDIDALLGVIASGGLRVRVRLVVAAQRWGDLRPGLRDLLGTRWEMRLTDSADSGFARNSAALLVGAPAGRVLCADGLLAHAYLPPSALVSRGGPRSRRLLPLPALVSSRSADQLGVRAGDLAVLRCDCRGHMLILGDRGSGRTALLRRVAVAGAADPLGRRLTVIDPRRGLTALAQRPGVAWTSGGSDTEAAVEALLGLLTERRRDSASLRRGADRWWSGPDHLLVVDDADILPGGAYGGLLAPLAEFVRTGPDLGFGIALARGVSGLARSGFEPMTAALQECAGTTVLLRGDPAEGAVAGGLRARSDRPPGRCSWITEGAVTDAQLIFDADPRLDGASVASSVAALA